MQPVHRSLVAAALVLVMIGGCAGGDNVSSGPASAALQPSTSPILESGAPSPDAGEPSAAATSTPAASPTDPARDDLPSRVVIEALDIDLPIVSGDLEVAGNAPDYPLCDVAQYLTTYRYPGRPGTTWIYAHAREGMFLPLLRASERKDGKSLIGTEVEVYSTGARRYTYRITDVYRHALDRSVAAGLAADERILVLQTSEGPKGTVPKLQIAAEFTGVSESTADAATPSAAPRDCS
ncbi:hypothetical protein BH20CHL7_BH20CHL7_01220 [soil metagenome]